MGWDDSNHMDERADSSSQTEQARLQVLRSYAVLDTPTEAAYDQLVALAAQVCATPIALISFVADDRQWFKAKCGIGATGTARDIAFCAHAILHEHTMVVEDAHLDPLFRDNPLVTGPPHIRFYAGVPLRSRDGYALGTLCVADTLARALTRPAQVALETLARQVEAQMEMRLQLREVAQLGLELARQRDAIQRLEQQKRDLIGLVVHDLKSPLTCILAEAEFIGEDTTLVGESKAAMATIVTAAEAMHRLVLDLLDIGRSEDGELQLKPSDIDIDAIMAEAQRHATQHAATQGTSIRVTSTPSRFIVHADRNLIRRVIENLLDNSLKYGRGTRIELVARIGEEGLEVSVSDHGPGVPVSQRATIFSKYAQLDRDKVHTERGSRGLGLSFCKLAVEAHGGRIWVEDGEPTGARFCFVLPVQCTLVSS